MTAWPLVMHSPDWYERRRSGITGTDIVVLAGLSPYDRGPHDIYLDKVDPPEPTPPSPAMEVGLVIEDAIADLYARRTGRKLTRSHVLARSKAYPFAIGNIDRRVRGERRLVEIKNRRYFNREQGLPPDIHCQIQWYEGVLGYEVADAVILVGGSDLQVIEVPAEPDYFADLLEIARDFWVHHVLTRVPPELDGSEGAARYLARAYPSHHGEQLVVADATLTSLAADYRQAKADVADAQGRMGTAENAIKALLGDAPGVQGDGFRITWKRSADYQRLNWSGIATDLLRLTPGDVGTEIVEKNTTTVEGTRRFVPTFDEGSE